MSDTAEMVRLIRHAADRIAAECPPEELITHVAGLGSKGEREPAATALTSMVAAMALAEAVLRMVAACMEPESEPHVRAVNRVQAVLAASDGVYVRADELAEALEVAS